MKLRKYIPEFIVLAYAVLFLITKNPSNEWDRVIVSDGKGYYAYLTALFIYDDTDYGFIDSYETEYYPASRQLYKDYRFDTGDGIVNKYFPGPAVLWLPFFGAGHAAAHIFGYQTDGYSLPYQMAIAFAAIFYFWLSLLILRKILRFYTKNETAIGWSLLAVGLATNLIYYTVNSGCQVHVYNFFLINGFIYSILEASRRGKPVFFASAAFMLGMVIISRPQNGLIIFALPFLCGDKKTFLHFFRKLFTDIKTLVLSVVAIAVPLLVPITYWYAKTGHWLVYSYGSESYDLTKPKMLTFLFSFEKGWLIYTPVAALAILGFVFLFRKSKWQFASLAAFLFFVVYFISSWWTWHYTSYVSQRVMIDYYAFVAILIVFIFNWLKNKKQAIALQVILSGFVAFNLMQHFQHMIWVYPAGPVTAKTYFSNFLSFSKGTTFMIPENEILGKQTYSTDFESDKPIFQTSGFEFSNLAHSGAKSVLLDTASKSRLLFSRGMPDYKEVQPLILKIGGFYNPETTDSSLMLEVGVGSTKNKYSVTRHNLMPGLKKNEWKYAEMVIYMPYIRSVSDSVFISIQNMSSGNALLDDLQVEFLKMQGPTRHDWILPSDDVIDSASIFLTTLETPLESPWSNSASISSQLAFSGSKSSYINQSSPYSVVFEKDMDGKKDGYFRVSSRISGDTSSLVSLVFDFSAKGKTVFYKTYPVKLKGNNSSWNLSEIFREFPVRSLKVDKVKIYYWLTKGNSPVYIDDLQVDIVNYKAAKRTVLPAFPANKNAKSLHEVICDFELPCQPETGFQPEVSNAFSGTKVCLINREHPFSFSHLLPLSAIENQKNAFVYVTAQVNSDHYSTGATLVADFRNKGKSVSYNPAYLRGQTIKGEWNAINFGFEIPKNITVSDSVLVYFYIPKTDEVMLIDDFCVRIKEK
jgi:hypothetical protein